MDEMYQLFIMALSKITNNLVYKSQEKKIDYINRKYIIKANLWIFYLNEFYDYIKPYTDSNELFKMYQKICKKNIKKIN